MDSFIFGIFGARERGWSADTVGVLNKHGQRCPFTNRWRVLSDRCHSVAALVRSKLPDKAEITLDQLLVDLGELAFQQHPSFIATFWRICLRLQSIHCHIPKAKPLDRLFSVLLNSQQKTIDTSNSNSDEKPNPIYLLIDSLRHINREELRHVLRIGYVKTIMTLTQLIGDENIMVLDMLSFYCRFFATRYLTRQTLIAKFEYVWHAIHSPPLSSPSPSLHSAASTAMEISPASVAITYSFAYAAYYVCDAPYLALGMAERLRNVVADHPHLAGFRAQWSLEAEAFSCCSLVVARIYRERVNQRTGGGVGGGGRCPDADASDEFAKCCASIQGAITKLESGDRDCRTRAASSSRLLVLWLGEWGLLGEAREEERRAARIESSIAGRMCRGCLRERYCRICEVYILEENADGPRSSCGRCKPHKFTRLCQKCKGRALKQEVRR